MAKLTSEKRIKCLFYEEKSQVGLTPGVFTRFERKNRKIGVEISDKN
jgi:hypothetical protein